MNTTPLKIIHPRILHSYLSGIIPQNKKQEDLILQNKPLSFHSENEVKKLLLKNNYFVTQKPAFYSYWLNQQTIVPDFLANNTIVEVKSMKYYDKFGRLQTGSAGEKIDSVFRKYSEFYVKYGYKTVVVLCANMIYDKNSTQFLENFGNNQAVNLLIKNFKNIYFTTFSDLEKNLEKLIS